MTTSFIIPAYNEEKYIEKCLESINNLEGLEDFEVIVVDNNSTDNTVEIVRKKFPKVRILRETKKGPNWARQKGFKNAKGEILVFFDADNIIPSRWYFKMRELLNSDKDIVALTGPYKYYSLNFWHYIGFLFIYFIQGKLVHFLINDLLQKGPFLFGGNFTVRQEALKKIGGFDTKYRFYGDDFNVGRRLNTVGKIKMFNRLFVYSSPRRIKMEGFFKTICHYTMGLICEFFFKKPFLTTYTDPR